MGEKGMDFNMKIKTGIDIIEVSRIKKAIETSNEAFIEKVFTKKEIEYCNSKVANKYEHFAARFAAKEACLKAISDLMESKFDISWKEIEIINLKNGKPALKIHKDIKDVESIDISLSHVKEYAVASVCILIA